jgi:hypothetical protein
MVGNTFGVWSDGIATSTDSLRGSASSRRRYVLPTVRFLIVREFNSRTIGDPEC